MKPSGFPREVKSTTRGGFDTAGSDASGTSFVNAFSLLPEFGELDCARSVFADNEGSAA